jgi:chaperonin cofactor prefoldin
MKGRKSKEEVVELIKSLPDGRKIYYNLGPLLVEVTKEEAIKLLEEEGEE